MDTTHNIAQRFDWLDKGVAEGRVLRRVWREGEKRPANGYERACLLAMLAPEVGEHEGATACPTWLLPPWFANLVPWMDDAGSAEAWPAMIQRFARVVRRAALELTDEQWARVEYRVRALLVREALRHITTDAWGVKAACEEVVALCERRANGETVAARAFAEAADAAYAAARAADAAGVAARAARMAADGAAAFAEAGAAARAAYAAAGAADAAARAAGAAGAAYAAARAADAAARAAAYAAGATADAAGATADAADRIHAAVLDAIETALTCDAGPKELRAKIDALTQTGAVK
jgi:hypothetical protein